ncbi:transcriptional regulator BetI [Falsigemmobacter faecalis]|uniref:HTH-type transcriptional regulator BetI n=1 Tax=Falsigemmobacter faecalis TaxID=2488730 RepID=A0A3P3DMI9_9RHOB|nr:transcriptional regulator BetI [Falsigemmobacter faecalis]RRH75479.1 transcriptional regulator BetI [Falsigemmobacter faecalis]
MPRLGMEPIRKAALVKAAIEEIGASSTLDVTVSQIARRAGVSSALAHHYFGSKEEILLAAMRDVLTQYCLEIRAALRGVQDPARRLRVILHTSFGPENFRREIISAWLTFWVMARAVPKARRLLTIYERRLQSNLLCCLRPLTGPRAPELATATGALIDGVYLRTALSGDLPDGNAAVSLIENMIFAPAAGREGISTAAL